MTSLIGEGLYVYLLLLPHRAQKVRQKVMGVVTGGEQT